MDIERAIDAAWRTIATHPDKHEKICALLKLKRLCREAQRLPPVRTPAAPPRGLLPDGVAAKPGRIS